MGSGYEKSVHTIKYELPPLRRQGAEDATEWFLAENNLFRMFSLRPLRLCGKDY
jgi:hypothetical protein